MFYLQLCDLCLKLSWPLLLIPQNPALILNIIWKYINHWFCKRGNDFESLYFLIHRVVLKCCVSLYVTENLFQGSVDKVLYCIIFMQGIFASRDNHLFLFITRMNVSIYHHCPIGRQFGGKSSVEMYRQCLLAGCR